MSSLIITSSESVKEKTNSFKNVPTLKEAKLILLNEKINKIFISDLHPSEYKSLNTFVNGVSTHPDLSELLIYINSDLLKFSDYSKTESDKISCTSLEQIISIILNKPIENDQINIDPIDELIDLSAKSIAKLKLLKDKPSRNSDLIKLYKDILDEELNKTI